MRVVISQSMLFPWVGLLEQVRLADVFVHYDDVQFSKGSFVNRVQIKTPQGIRWMTIPLKRFHLGQRINEIEISSSVQWREQHLELLQSSFQSAPYAEDALQLAKEIYSIGSNQLVVIVRASLLVLARYFGLDINTRFIDVTELEIPGSSGNRVLAVVSRVQGNTYITGHGARRYLDHEYFERAGVRVEYINYRCTPYPQSYGAFSPYISSLDLIANCGRLGAKYICSDTVSWRKFLNEPSR